MQTRVSSLQFDHFSERVPPVHKKADQGEREKAAATVEDEPESGERRFDRFQLRRTQRGRQSERSGDNPENGPGRTEAQANQTGLL